MILARSAGQLQDACARLRRSHRCLVLVPTMGALHEGHRALLARAREEGGAVAASVFVNPTQFDAAADFARYPRDEAADLTMLREAGCDLVWLPDPGLMYPLGDATRVMVDGPARGWEDAHRPGHFAGVATVVAKLFGQIRPEAAVFGEKDWQQLQTVRRMAEDLHLGVRVLGLPTVREPDGLALSSRNRFLTPAQRRTAPLLHETLAALSAALLGDAPASPALVAARARLDAAGFGVDYLALVDGPTLRAVERTAPGARLIAAARLGTVRLIDNVAA